MDIEYSKYCYRYNREENSVFTTYIIVIFIAISIVIGVLFFKLSSDNNDDFILYWSISWIFYSVALLCLLMAVDRNMTPCIEIKKLFDMYSIQCFLVGIYKFGRIKIPGYWLRFSIYLTIWLIISLYLNIDRLSTSIPIALYDLIMAGTICYIVIRYWKEHIKVGEKIFYCFCFIVWGIIKAYLAVFEGSSFSSSNIYIGEILYTNLLNVCILVIYLRHVKFEMNKTEERFKIIVENAIDAIFYYTFKPAPAFLYITPSIATITGYSPSIFYKNPRAMLEIVDKQSFEMINKLFFSGAGSTFSTTSEVFKIEKKDGECIWAEMNVSVIKDGNETVAIEGIIRDITQMKEIQEDLTTSKKSRDLMLSYISHELKTPITSILGYATAIKDGTISKDKELKKAMGIISQKSLLLERMILDLFQLSQLETNQYSFAYEHMNGIELAEYIREYILAELRAADIKHSVIIDKGELENVNVIADPIRINQVITNLVVNAVKYTRENNRITVKFTVDGNRKNIIINVADKGKGIHEEDIPYVFDRFYKADKTADAEMRGRGLGLALSKEIITAHGGSITVRSRYGKGSVFTVKLPVYYE